MCIQELERSYGLTVNDLGELWHGGKPISLHSVAAQEILLDAVRYRAAKRGITAASRKPAPPVVRPGVRSGRSSEDAVDAAARVFRAAPSVKNAARHLAAGEGDAEFMRAKIVTARFYGESMLPKIDGLAAEAMGGSDLALALAAGQF